MAHAYFSKILDVPADDAWAMIRDFGSLPVWCPFVKRSELRGGGPYEVGTIRANTMADDGVMEERLLEISERHRRIVFDIVAADIAPAVAFLCSEEAGWVTGQLLVADGGMSHY